VAFQRKNPAAIGVKAPFPGFIEPALASSIEKVPGTAATFPAAATSG
jgi:bifunctional non-homologous end joining protein LigD